MARMDELYDDIYAYCEEHECWSYLKTITEWNKVLNNIYGVPSFTALVNAGKLEKEQRYGERAYSYRIAPTGRAKELVEAQKAAEERKNAEWLIAHYEGVLARHKAHYEQNIKQIEEQYQRNLEREAERLEKAKKLLEDVDYNF